MSVSSPSRTLLLIDDNQEDRSIIRRLVGSRRPDFVIHEVTTGGEALDLCRTAMPDCVLLDFHLPDMNGTDCIRRLAAAVSDVPAAPTVVITGREDAAVAADVLQAGAEDYLVKETLTGLGLVRAIENAVEKSRIRQELDDERRRVDLRNRALGALYEELQARIAELASATHAKDRFLGVMSHEMRTPLNAILGYADLLDLELDGALSDGQRQHVDRIRAGSQHLLEVINDLLDLTQMDAERLALDIRPVNVRATIEEVTALMQVQAAKKGLSLVADATCGDDGRYLPPVLADLQRLRQVLINLVGNAIKFSERGGITVRCRWLESTRAVAIDIQDTGIGIEVAALRMIFSEFYQVDAELTRRRDGSGLGLTIAKRLVERMGGRISVESVPGAGSTFTVTLPGAAPGSVLRDADIAEHDARMAAHAGADDSLTVDSPPAALATVVAYGDDASALAQLEQRLDGRVRLLWTTKPDTVATLTAQEHATLVILDMRARGDTAWHIAHAMHETSDLTSTAVLLVPAITASHDGDMPGVDLGWVSLVPKPFTPQQLTAAVSAANRSAAPAADAARRSVLVVDDDADSRRVAATVLATAGFAVREAPDGESALAAMRARAPSVVVLDLMMPVLDGFGVLATVRADPQLRHIPVVVLTAKTLNEAERQFLGRSAARVLQKGTHRLADIAALVLRATDGVRQPTDARRGDGA